MSPITSDKYSLAQPIDSPPPHYFHQVFNNIPSEIRKGPGEYLRFPPDASELDPQPNSSKQGIGQGASEYKPGFSPEPATIAPASALPQTADNSTVSLDHEATATSAFTICASLVSVLALVFLLYFSWRFFGRRRRNFLIRSTSCDSVSVHTSFEDCSPEKCLGSSRLGSLRQAVTGPFRSSRRQSSEPYKISSSHRQDKDSFEANRWGNSTRLGLTEAELSQILSSPPCDQPMLSPGESTTTQSTLPTDSWDQYMSILKHEEHLHFEDITPVHSGKNPTAEISYHRDHPSLLSHYFNSTFGGLNRIEPFNGLAATKGSLAAIKATQEYEMTALSQAPAVSIFHRKRVPSKVSLFEPKNNGSLALTHKIIPAEILDPPTTATAECGMVLKPTPRPTMASPPLSPSAHWSQPDPLSQLLHSPTAASMPEFRLPKPTAPPVTTPVSAKLNPAGWSSPHLVADLNRLPVLLETPHS